MTPGPKNRGLSEGFLLTDHYQLTMAQLYFELGYHEKTVCFEHFFRNYPDYDSHKAGYCISAGWEWLVEWMIDTKIRDEEIECLRKHRTQEGKRVFQDDFLHWLRQNGNFDSLSLRAVPEGRVIHPNEPICSVQGPLALCQILETALLNTVNYQILVATKAARIKYSAGGGPVMEFGIRRAQEHAAAAGSRAALIGGADGTSYAGAAHMLGQSPKGTHAHSMVQFFLAMGMSELDAFRAFARRYPDNCILLVDTIDTLSSGIPNAIKVFEELKKQGYRPRGIRLDSGDLAYLSMEAHKMLNAAGFENALIVLSNELDELLIWQIAEQIRRESSQNGVDPQRVLNRLAYGVGTHLITSRGCPALNAVYKLAAVREGDDWKPVLKSSDSPQKIPNPGIKDLWRVYNGRCKATADLVCCKGESPCAEETLSLYHPVRPGVSRKLGKNEIGGIEPLLINMLEKGRVVYDFPDFQQIGLRRRSDIDALDSGVKRLINPHRYHVSLSKKLLEMKEALLSRMKYNQAVDSPVF